MAIRVIALIKDGDKTVGFRLYDENSGAIGNFTSEEAFSHLSYYGCSNAKVSGNDLTPTECSFTRFAVLDSKFNVTKDGGIIVLNCIKKGDETIGYTLVNIKGEKIRVPKEEAIKLANKYGVSNASLVQNGDTSYLRGIKKDIPISTEHMPTKAVKPQINYKNVVTANLIISEMIVEGTSLFLIDLNDLTGVITPSIKTVVRRANFRMTEETPPSLHFDSLRKSYDPKLIIGCLDYLLNNTNILCTKIEIYYGNIDEHGEYIKVKEIKNLTEKDLKNMTPELAFMLNYVLNSSLIDKEELALARKNPSLISFIKESKLKGENKVKVTKKTNNVGTADMEILVTRSLEKVEDKANYLIRLKLHNINEQQLSIVKNYTDVHLNDSFVKSDGFYYASLSIGGKNVAKPYILNMLKLLTLLKTPIKTITLHLETIEFYALVGDLIKYPVGELSSFNLAPEEAKDCFEVGSVELLKGYKQILKWGKFNSFIETALIKDIETLEKMPKAKV